MGWLPALMFGFITRGAAKGSPCSFSYAPCVSTTTHGRSRAQACRAVPRMCWYPASCCLPPAFHATADHAGRARRTRVCWDPAGAAAAIAPAPPTQPRKAAYAGLHSCLPNRRQNSNLRSLYRGSRLARRHGRPSVLWAGINSRRAKAVIAASAPSLRRFCRFSGTDSAGCREAGWLRRPGGARRVLLRRSTCLSDRRLQAARKAAPG